MYEEGLDDGVALALRIFEVLHHSLPVWVEGIGAVRLAVAAVPLALLGNAHFPLLVDGSEEALPLLITL